jgi:hypothetical protein
LLGLFVGDTLVWVGVCVGWGVLVGVRVFVGEGISVSVGAGVVGMSVGVSAITVSLAPGVIESISPTVGVLVGARVGSGAWVGVASKVLWGSSSVEGGGGWVGVPVRVGGRMMMVVTASGLVRRYGRISKLPAPRA